MEVLYKGFNLNLTHRVVTIGVYIVLLRDKRLIVSYNTTERHHQINILDPEIQLCGIAGLCHIGYGFLKFSITLFNSERKNCGKVM